jgi:hypothetical protein
MTPRACPCCRRLLLLPTPVPRSPPLQVTGEADGASLLITLESKVERKVGLAAARLRELLPPGCIISEEAGVAELSRRRRSAEFQQQ